MRDLLRSERHDFVPFAVSLEILSFLHFPFKLPLKFFSLETTPRDRFHLFVFPFISLHNDNERAISGRTWGAQQQRKLVHRKKCNRWLLSQRIYNRLTIQFSSSSFLSDFSVRNDAFHSIFLRGEAKDPYSKNWICFLRFSDSLTFYRLKNCHSSIISTTDFSENFSSFSEKRAFLRLR